MLHTLPLQTVKLLPGIFRERRELNRNYLLKLENKALLQNFYLEAGLILPGYQVLQNPDTDGIHWGWEAPVCQLRGHFLGHFLSAAAVLYASTKDLELKVKLDSMIEELKKLQELNGGEWLASIPEKYFEKLAQNQYIWSPQYVMHKTILGLLDAYRYAKNNTALSILDHLSDWYVRWTGSMLERNPAAIYSGEEAGMLEVWASLYELTGNEKYMLLSERYSNPQLFRDLTEGRDALTNWHENASIPWSHGAAKLYEITGDEKWRRLVEAFWKNAVTDRGYYCTGAQGAGEFWVPPHQQGHFLCGKNQEFCTVYNMVRTAEYLYRWTGETVYADYIERNLYNGFLSQQNQYTGMPTYFLPLKAGARKTWGSERRDFWCCHGTMVQAQTIYSSLIYLEDAGKNQLIVGQYIPSELEWSCNGTKVHIEQMLDMKAYNTTALFDANDAGQMSRWSIKFRINCEQPTEFELLLRIPSWVKGKPLVEVNNAKTASCQGNVKTENSYLHIQKTWEQDEISLCFPCEIKAEYLPDVPDTAAFLEGPIVLAGLCEQEMELKLDSEKPAEYFLPQYEHTYNILPWKQSTYKTLHQAGNLEFVPLYEITDEAYTVYFSIASPPEQ